MKYILLLPMILFFIACEKQDEESRIAQMHWDRDMCARCVMVISDRKNSVQVQLKNMTYKFDDIGCMVVWSNDTKIDLEKIDNIYITDISSGEWIDAKKAFYTSGNLTPMGFGYSAYSSKKNINKTKKIYTFSEVYAKIKK